MTPRESQVAQADRLKWLNELYRGQQALSAAQAGGDPAAATDARGRMKGAGAKVRELTLAVEGG